MASSRWLERLLELPRAKLLVRVDEDFLSNTFNITGLKQKIAHFTPAYELVRRSTTLTARGAVDLETLSREAEDVYGLIHARYLITRPGLDLMFKKFEAGEFMKCPRVNCRGAQCLPYGETDELGQRTVKMYCPYCSDIYNPTDPDIADVDGAYFGSSWIHMFLQRYPSVIPSAPMKLYVPRIFGFRMCYSSDIEDESSAGDE